MEGSMAFRTACGGNDETPALSFGVIVAYGVGEKPR